MRPLRVLFARATGPYARASHAAWKQMLTWLEEQRVRESIGRGIGVMHDDPGHVGPVERRYDACVELQPGIAIDGRAFIGRQSLPGGAYAVHRLKGSSADLRRTLKSLRRDWSPSDDLMIDATRPFLEIFLDDPRTVNKSDVRIAIHIPVTVHSDVTAGHTVAAQQFA